MQNISQQTLQDFCRTCLKKLNQRQKCNIHCLDLQIRQWLQYDSVNNPLAKDIFSSNICHLCRDKLEELFEFRKMCARSRKTVEHILQKEKYRKHIEAKVETKEQKDVLQQKTDWLEFDFVVPDKIESTIESASCKKNKYDVEDVEPLINNTQQSNTKKGTEPDPIESFFVNDKEIKNKKENEENSASSDSGSEFETYADQEEESLESESETGSVMSKTNSGNKQTRTKIKTAKSRTTDVKKNCKYQCDQCSRRCLSQQTLDNHKRTHQGLKPFQCPKCDRSFNKSTHIREHLNEVHAEEKLNIICEYEGCGKQFQRSRSYKEHFRLKHKQQKKSVVKTQPQHVCEDCGKTFVKLARLKIHQFTHKPKDQYPFKCTDCDKAFTRKCAFKEHQLRHAGIKNFECPYCGMKKTTKNELRAHINYHTKDRQWLCPRCPMVFNSPGNLRMHDQVVHQGLRRWACRFCEETFGKQDSLKHHEMRHTGEKPHVCTECGKCFIQKVALKAHMKTHNKYLAKHQSELRNLPSDVINQK